MKKKIALAALLSLVALSGFAVGQNIPNSAAQNLLQNSIAADNGDSAAFGPLMEAYAKMPGDADATKQAARLALVDGKKGNNGSGFAALVMQNQKIIEQNDRIAALLEKIAAKK